MDSVKNYNHAQTFNKSPIKKVMRPGHEKCKLYKEISRLARIAFIFLAGSGSRSLNEITEPKNLIWAAKNEHFFQANAQLFFLKDSHHAFQA